MERRVHEQNNAAATKQFAAMKIAPVASSISESG